MHNINAYMMPLIAVITVAVLFRVKFHLAAAAGENIPVNYVKCGRIVCARKVRMPCCNQTKKSLETLSWCTKS